MSPASSPPVWELFHAIAHPPSARARRYVTDNALEDRIEFRNVGFESHAQALRERGGSGESLPALWDGRDLYEGAEAVIARLQTLVNLGREG
ncbi:MAG: hypothetical protein IRZ16_04650 [Myxococcaceae bacterium]|nr:hypothetical protein [Myxococcaceae bacterium]